MQGFYYVPVPLGAKKPTSSNGIPGCNPTLAIASAHTDPSKKPRVNVPLMKGRASSSSSSVNAMGQQQNPPSSSSNPVASGYMNFNPMNMNMNHHLTNMNMNHHASSLISSSNTAAVSTGPSSSKTTSGSSSQMHNLSSTPVSSGQSTAPLPSTASNNNNSQSQNPTNHNNSHHNSTSQQQQQQHHHHHHAHHPHHHNNVGSGSLPLTSVHQANASAPIFTGLWHLNRAKSDSVNNYLEAMGLPSIARQAADKLDLAVIVHQTAHEFTITRKTRIFTDTKTLKFGHDMILKNVPMRMTACAQSLKTVSQLPQVRGVLIDTRTLEMGGQMMHVVLELNLPDKPPTIVHRYFDKVSESTSLDIDEALYNTLYTPPSEVKRKR